MNKTIDIRNDPSAQYVAFGDDSKFGDILVFAFFVIARKDIDRMNKRIAKIKRKFGVPEVTILHCRELFHPHPREKAGLGHLSSERARSIVGHIIHELNVLDCRVSYAFLRSRPGEMVLPGVGGIPVHYDDKGMLSMLAQACYSRPGGALDPRTGACEIFVAEDRTKIQFLGAEFGRADKWTAGFSDVGAEPGTVFRITPRPIPVAGHPMMQIADVLAYTCSHALSGVPPSPFFKDHLARVRRLEVAEMFPNGAPTPYPIPT